MVYRQRYDLALLISLLVHGAMLWSAQRFLLLPTQPQLTAPLTVALQPLTPNSSQRPHVVVAHAKNRMPASLEEPQSVAKAATSPPPITIDLSELSAPASVRLSAAAITISANSPAPPTSPTQTAAPLQKTSAIDKEPSAPPQETMATGEEPSAPPEETTATDEKPRISYLQSIVPSIKAQRRYPLLARMRNRQGTVVVAIKLSERGKLLSSVIRETSGHVMLDDEAIDMVARAAPFIPPPSILIDRFIEIPIQFSLVNP